MEYLQYIPVRVSHSQLKLTMELTFLCSLNHEKTFFFESLSANSLYTANSITLNLIKFCLLKQSSFTTVSMSFCIILFHISQAVFLSICNANSDIITSQLNFWDGFPTDLTAFKNPWFQCIVHGINFPNTSGSASKEVRLMLKISKRNYMSNSLINFTLMEIELPCWLRQ